jgi:hypothetical protein
VCDWFSYGVVPLCERKNELCVISINNLCNDGSVQGIFLYGTYIWDHIILFPVSSCICLGMYVATPALPMDADICGALRLAVGLFHDVCIRRHYLCMFSLSGIMYGEA